MSAKVDSQELHSLTRRDPLAFGITYINLLEQRKWEVATRAWIQDIYATLNPWVIEKYPQGQARRLVITKSTQAGLSTMALVKALHFATNWPVRIGYTLPRQQDTLDFVSTRTDPVIQASPFLRSKLGQPDSAHAKRIGDSYLFFMEMSTEPRMMPLDSVFVDEVDLSNPDNLATILNRLDASRWKLQMYLSTPTVANYGIHGLYVSSDGREWLVKCPKCNHEQALSWDVNLRIMGPANNPTQVFYGCAQCSAELTVEHIQTGRWVAQRPDRSTDTVGYHVHQMLTTPASELYRAFRDPQTRLVEFYRKRMGLPYEIGGGSLERDDFLATCFDEPYDFEPVWDGQSAYYLGADQGNEIQVLVCKVEPHSRRPKIVHVELIPIQKGFDRLSQLMDIYHVRKAVIDANPNRHGALSMVNRFPGRVLIADYIEQKEAWRAKKSLERNYLTNVTLNRTAAFDGLMEAIKKGEWALPGKPPLLHPDVELVIDHLTALKRDIETRRTASGDVQVAVWRKLRADHLAHAWLYLKTAIEVACGKSLKVAVIGQDKAEPEREVESGQPDKETQRAITALLAEVPREQIAEYLHQEAEGEEGRLPFPLAYKLNLAKEQYSLEEIRWVMNALFQTND